ncbi:CHASE domain-containing protein [Caenispirillum salinarum]|uniref:CHASE domain-containing protein n=1 Tax=Caenispirillum salinarum TaxID=859058 RepID=UPI00384E789E
MDSVNSAAPARGPQRRRPWVAAALAMALTALALLGVERLVAASTEAAEHAAVLDRAATLRARLEQVVNRNVLLLRGLTAHMSHYPETSEAEFTRLARALITDGPQIRNLAFARGTTLAYAYPKEPNAATIGINIAALPEQRDAVLRAIDARDVVVAGPVPLIQGGEGLIGRMPVFLSPSDAPPASGPFVGLVSMAMDSRGLWRDAGLLDPELPLRVALRGRDATGAAGDLFFGDAEVFRSDPVLLDVLLAGQGTWQLAALPAGGWSGGGAVLWIVRALALALVVTAGVLARLLTARAEERRRVETALRRTATVDLETGVDNRRRFEDAGAAEMARCRRFGHQLTVLAIRLTDADALDARHGAGAAAAVRRAVAAQARGSLRMIDTVARVSPDVFAVLLPETEPLDAAVAGRRLIHHIDLTGVPWRDQTVVPRIDIAVTRLRREDGGIVDTLERALARLPGGPAEEAPPGRAAPPAAVA